MTILWRATANDGQVSSPLTITKPAGTAENDLLVLHLNRQTGGTPTVPAGFEAVPGSDLTGNNGIAIYVKKAGASEPADYTVSWTGGSGMRGALSAIYSDSAQAIAADAVSAKANASGDRVWDQVVTTVANTFLMCFSSSQNQIGTPHSGMDERYDTGGAHIYLMTAIVAGAGATGSRTANGVSTQNNCVAIAFREGAAGAGSLGSGAIDSSIFGGSVVR